MTKSITSEYNGNRVTVDYNPDYYLNTVQAAISFKNGKSLFLGIKPEEISDLIITLKELELRLTQMKAVVRQVENA